MTEQNIAMKFFEESMQEEAEAGGSERSNKRMRYGGISRKQRNLLDHGGITPEEVDFVEDKTRAGKSKSPEVQVLYEDAKATIAKADAWDKFRENRSDSLPAMPKGDTVGVARKLGITASKYKPVEFFDECTKAMPGGAKMTDLAFLHYKKGLPIEACKNLTETTAIRLKDKLKEHEEATKAIDSCGQMSPHDLMRAVPHERVPRRQETMDASGSPSARMPEVPPEIINVLNSMQSPATPAGRTQTPSPIGPAQHTRRNLAASLERERANGQS